MLNIQRDTEGNVARNAEVVREEIASGNQKTKNSRDRKERK